MSDEQVQVGKEWYKSKTIWVNVITIVAVIMQANLGVGLTGEEQVGLLAVINLILRFVTANAIKEMKTQ